MLLHGAGDAGWCLEPFARALGGEVERRFGEVLQYRLPDAPAHGGRPYGEDPTIDPRDTVAPDHLVADALAAVTAFVAETGGPIVLGGHSMGAASAAAIAAARPDLVAGLWMEDPAWDDEPGTPPPADVEVLQMRDWLLGCQRTALADLVAGSRWGHPNWPEDEHEPWCTAKQRADTRAFDHPLRWAVASWDATAEAITCPVLIVAGDIAAGSMFLAPAERYLTGRRGWRIVRFPGVGHDVRRERRAAVIDLTCDFLAALSRPAA